MFTAVVMVTFLVAKITLVAMLTRVGMGSNFKGCYDYSGCYGYCGCYGCWGHDGYSGCYGAQWLLWLQWLEKKVVVWLELLYGSQRGAGDSLDLVNSRGALASHKDRLAYHLYQVYAKVSYWVTQGSASLPSLPSLPCCLKFFYTS